MGQNRREIVQRDRQATRAALARMDVASTLSAPTLRAIRIKYVLARLSVFAALAAIFIVSFELNDTLLVWFGSGVHPLTALLMLFMSLGLLGGGAHMHQNIWRRGVFWATFLIALGHVLEREVLGTQFAMDVSEALLGQVPAGIVASSSTAIVIALLSLGALLRRHAERIGFAVVLAAIVPLTHGAFALSYGHAQEAGALSPVTLVVLSCLALSELLAYARGTYMRPMLTNSIWGRFARLQLIAILVGAWAVGWAAERVLGLTSNEWTLSALLWFFALTLFAAGPYFTRMESENRRLQRELRAQAALDPLTGLRNRRGVRDFISVSAARRNRRGTPSPKVGVVLADIDFFKQVNDICGHEVGDDILCQVSDIMRSRIRSTDVLARWGGEEFLLLLPGADLEATMAVAQTLRAAVAAHVSWMKEGQKRQITISMGVACYDPSVASSMEAVIQQADTALYAAKAHGRNRVRRFLSGAVDQTTDAIPGLPLDERAMH